ncbi:MAG: hypothetical protein WBA92_05760 [Pseudorhodobacter sp.]
MRSTGHAAFYRNLRATTLAQVKARIIFSRLFAFLMPTAAFDLGFSSVKTGNCARSLRCVPLNRKARLGAAIPTLKGAWPRHSQLILLRSPHSKVRPFGAIRKACEASKVTQKDIRFFLLRDLANAAELIGDLLLV